VIAIDTNVMLRYLLADDRGQYRRAKKLIESNFPVLITDVVLAEIVWTLMGKRFGFDKAQICVVIRTLIGDQGFAFENSQTVWSALNDYEISKTIRGKQLDFADALIGRKAGAVARQKTGAFDGFFSFDKAVSQLAGAKVIPL
jgi:predicted nucleic-acid-binding protein